MVQISTTLVLTLLLAIPALAAPMTSDDFNEIDSRDLNELESRKLHFHISAKKAKKLLHSLDKYGATALKYGTKVAAHTKYGKYLKYGGQAFKALTMAKGLLKRNDEFDYYDLVARDMDPVDELEELLARTPGRRIRKALKTVKKIRKHLKKLRKQAKAGDEYHEHRQHQHHQHQHSFKASATGAGVGGVTTGADAAIQPVQNPQPTDATAPSPTDIAARELDGHLEILERAFSLWAGEIEERDFYGDNEDLFQRDYEEFGLDELD
ncbi:hypothetical protein CPB84DRAFT_726837 [Gymnopilus junonius]|uniref:RxLR effector protein n=1 Tax=Gymnopilus junonius TaxID=109634 RepID=A0A9P5TQ15_GYMJU|nr:hypothetical protein CPB84DRAFT_726837 [Gymnopilus junonius]